MHIRRLAGLVAVLACLSLAAGCASADGVAAEGDPASTVAALCATAEATDDPGTAEQVFYSRAHRPLHDIARDLEDRDRRAAARLLVAKNALESAFAEDAPPELVAERADALVTATREGLAAIDLDTPPCDGA